MSVLDYHEFYPRRKGKIDQTKEAPNHKTKLDAIRASNDGHCRLKRLG